MIRLTLPNNRVYDISPKDCDKVYYLIAEFLCDDIRTISQEKHQIAADAEGWAELACIGEEYRCSALPGLHIEIV